MGKLGQLYQTDPTGATKQFNDWQKQFQNQYNQVLTPQQQTSWQQMIGQPHNFTPGVYFQTNASTNPGGGTKE